MGNGVIASTTDGVQFANGATNNTVGGTVAGARNIISGNLDDGVEFKDAGTSNNVVLGNWIGLDATGAALGNVDAGVVFSNSATNNTLGGTAAGAGNIISGNANLGIYIVDAGTSDNVVQGNIIGLDSTSSVARPNSNDGIRLSLGPSNNMIGGTVANAGNIIAMNADDGVQVSGASPGNSILGNSIYGHNTDGTTIGIDLNITNGPDPNDGATNAAQPNNGMDLPVISTALLSGGTLTLDGYVGNTPSSVTFPNARVEFFISSNNPTGWGEGQTYLDFLTTNASSQFSGSFGVAGVNAGDEITATATDGAGNTSEFSLNVTIAAARSISGTVFEDINYGGGDGRDYSTADTSAQASGWAADAIGSGAGVVMELYEDQSGNFIKINDTTTDANGDYAFTGLSNDTYRVRVVNTSVRSNRGSNATGNTPLAVQTFRNDPDSGGAVTSEVGGASPSSADAGAQADSTDLSSITAQSVTEIVVSGSDVTNVDFGFNFDTVVNTNDTDQGSLRQFLLNSNELDNTNLDQEDNPSGVSAVTKSAGDEH
ncbi:MAG: hypothetical protein KAI25_03080, partial [Hyphomicrobiaceae bacterium]|nr:hypothetical protein [Hyphomicrobiaceae bacterium]